jgi:hypothetical protein
MLPLVLTPEGNSYRLRGGFDLSVLLDGETQDPGGAMPAPGSMIGSVAGARFELATFGL